MLHFLLQVTSFKISRTFASMMSGLKVFPLFRASSYIPCVRVRKQRGDNSSHPHIQGFLNVAWLHHQEKRAK